MAKYDYGGGCPCGLYAECIPQCTSYPGYVKPSTQDEIDAKKWREYIAKLELEKTKMQADDFVKDIIIYIDIATKPLEKVLPTLSDNLHRKSLLDYIIECIIGIKISSTNNNCNNYKIFSNSFSNNYWVEICYIYNPSLKNANVLFLRVNFSSSSPWLFASASKALI